MLEHTLWWHGPPWLKLEPSSWPSPYITFVVPSYLDNVQTSLLTTVQSATPLISFNDYSRFHCLLCVTAWMFRFINNCRSSSRRSAHLSVTELSEAKRYWIRLIQDTHFSKEIITLRAGRELSNNSSLIHLRPFVDSDGLLRVGGRENRANITYSSKHPIVLSGKHPLVRLIVRDEHQRLLHAGPTLMLSTLSGKFHITGMKKIVRSVTRQCITCRRYTTKPLPQQLCQLPIERVTPDIVFEKDGVDYAGPFLIKYGMVRKPTIVKAYLCIFVSLSVKAVHLEAVSDLTSEAFIAALRRFIAHLE